MEQQQNLEQVQLPDSFPVSVMMERRASSNQWIDYQWEAVGMSVGNRSENSERKVVVVVEEDEFSRLLYEGFYIRLYKDECESYYHNLMSPQPRCFVVADPDDDGQPIPFLLSLSFDEANAYLEGDQVVYAVDIPPELYRWCEAYVLANYVPEKKMKRKLTRWASPPANETEL